MYFSLRGLDGYVRFKAFLISFSSKALYTLKRHTCREMLKKDTGKYPKD